LFKSEKIPVIFNLKMVGKKIYGSKEEKI
jgi:hypothetical protein